MDVEASPHLEINKDNYSVATADPEEPEDPDEYSSFLTEVPEYHEVLGAGARDEGNTHNNPYYDMKIGLDVANIDKNEKKAWKTIYEAIDKS